VIARAPFFMDHPYAMVLCAALSIIICATLSYRYFELPARLYLRRLDKIRERQPVAS
jgi:peptidoglycan/LPS O-acetylase OafA/YrhL